MLEQMSDYALERWSLSLDEALSRLEELSFSQRLGRKDPSLWSSHSANGSEPGRLGWVDAPVRAADALTEWRSVSQRLLDTAPRRIFVLGMGGSSVFTGALSSLQARTRGSGRELVLVDSFYPATLSPLMELFAQPDSLIVVASKSGSTLETSVMASMAESVNAAARMIAITDPGTALEQRARDRGYAAVIHGFPDVGGRYSALTAFGLFPALLLGDPVEDIISAGEEMMRRCSGDIRIEHNPGAVLGAAIAAAWTAGREVFDVFTARGAGGFNAWVEQLLSESLGKEEVGVWPRTRGDDSLRLNAVEDDCAGVVIPEKSGLVGAGSLTWTAAGPGALGAEVYRWEAATVAAAVLMDVSPFNEPDVAVSKELAHNAFRALERGESQAWPAEVVRDGSWSVVASGNDVMGARASLQAFLASAKSSSDAISMLTFLPRTPEAACAIYGVANKMEAEYGVSVFMGFGPQYLHATGQLHKGGSDRAAHLVLTFEPVEAGDVPARNGVGIGALALAQGMADVTALRARGRNVLHLHYHGEHSEAGKKLGELIQVMG